MENPRTNDAPSSVRMIDAPELAAILKCSPRTVYRLVDAGRMPPPVRLGGLIRWNQAVINEWIAKGCPACRRGRGQQNSSN